MNFAHSPRIVRSAALLANVKRQQRVITAGTRDIVIDKSRSSRLLVAAESISRSRFCDCSQQQVCSVIYQGNETQRD
jgi:hypothetical protein